MSDLIYRKKMRQGYTMVCNHPLVKLVYEFGDSEDRYVCIIFSNDVSVAIKETDGLTNSNSFLSTLYQIKINHGD
jgi:hypothetical protein